MRTNSWANPEPNSHANETALVALSLASMANGRKASKFAAAANLVEGDLTAAK